MKRSLAMMLALIMVCALPGIASANGKGSINGACITQNAVSIELEDITFEKSVQVKLFSDETLLTTATLNEGFVDANQLQKYVTCCIPTKGADEAWSLTPWIPRDKIVPNKAVLFVDGNELDTKKLTLDAEAWAALPGTVPYSGSIERAAITHDNGILKNAVSVDLKNVNFESSVQVQLYSGETLLTTATLQGVNPGSYGFLTCCIATETADEYWALTRWTPRDNVVPDKAVLIVDGNKKDEKTFKLNADEWAALPGTVRPCSIESAIITRENKILKNAVSVELQDIIFKTSVQVQLYRDETLLTTATLKTGVLPVGEYYPFVTCCIPTEGEDAAWSLTSWTPKDDVVPNKAVLVVDGHEQDTKDFTLNAEDWANLPGTVPPSSGTIVIVPDRTEDTPKTDNQKNPSTGANDMVAAAVALMAVSALGMAVLTRKK